ncbi:fluoride efflux transporter CrcB [Lyngbya sp. PCC 8106]|uniref:fluoride efflux transporter CrcB n=1 Tax=Lyngbya sp. (strain PCC 8106) TaxID=313612 RepID=UPI0000EA97B7|nr:fluoride efflux transporter CrcB [Lyngbya sp. PCC 8106]EAW36796.1 Camphor resistance CrcB protein [Lyngbya sp. PCC 8106]
MIRILIAFLSSLSTSFSDAFSQPMIRNPIAIGLGAIAGALTRYYLTVWLASRFGTSFPYGTFFVNLTGCIGMGFLVSFSERIAVISPELVLLLAVGFLGSYTTFSTYELDTHRLLRDSRLETAIFYWMGSAIIGIIGIQIGMSCARLLMR